MKPKTKTFDCVEMKREIQARLAEKYKGMSDEERFTQLKCELMTSDDTIAKWWRKVLRAQNSNAD